MVMFREIKPRKTFLRCRVHDYSGPCFYFVTILTKTREHFFGEIVNKKVILSKMGQIVFDYWYKLPEYFPDIRLDEFVVMPNHVHGIIEQPFLYREEMNAMHIENQRLESTHQHLSKIIRLYKSGCTRIIKSLEPDIYFEWHRNYHDEIIRNKIALDRIRNYIRLNPVNWSEDENNIYLRER